MATKPTNEPGANKKKPVYPVLIPFYMSVFSLNIYNISRSDPVLSRSYPVLSRFIPFWEIYCYIPLYYYTRDI